MKIDSNSAAHTAQPTQKPKKAKKGKKGKKSQGNAATKKIKAQENNKVKKGQDVKKPEGPKDSVSLSNQGQEAGGNSNNLVNGLQSAFGVAA